MLSCNSSKDVLATNVNAEDQSTLSSNSTPTSDVDNYIVSFIVNVKMDNDVYQLSLENTIKAPGFLKKNNSKNQHGHDFFEVLIYDGNNEVLDQKMVENPLHQHYEYSNDEGSFENVALESNEGVFSVRTNYYPTISYMKIFSVNDESKLLLDKIELTIE